MKQWSWLIGLMFLLLLIKPNLCMAVDDLLPGKAISSPSYSHPSEAYILDMVPPNDPEWPDQAVQALHEVLQAIWSIYLWVIEFVMRIVQLSYDDSLFTKLFSFVDSLMPQIVASLWEPLWFIVAGVGIFVAILMWVRGQTNRSLTTLAAIVVLIAIIPISMTSLPTYLDQANRVATSISSDLLEQMLVPIGSAKNGMISQQSQQMIADTMWNSLVKRPYLFINFTSVKQEKAYFASLMKLKSNEEERIAKLREWGQIDAETGVTRNKAFAIFTLDGVETRGAKLFAVLLLIIGPIYLILAMSLMILVWKTRAIGRCLFFVFDGLMSLYPGYGARHMAQSVMQIFSAFLMVVIYSAALSIFFALWHRLLDAKAFGSDSYADQIFLVLLLIIGLWMAAKELASRFDGGNPMRRRGGLLTGAFMGAQLLRTVTRNPLTRWATQAVGKGIKGSTKAVGAGATKTGQAIKNYMSQVDAVQRMRHRMKERLPLDLTKSMQPEREKLTLNLSKRGRQVFQEMKRSRLDPTKKQHIKRYLQQRPDRSGAVVEMTQWLNRRPYEQLKESHSSDDMRIPMEPPPKHTPEYHTWSQLPNARRNYKRWLQAEKTVRERRWAEYSKRKVQYDSNPIRRLFLRRPKWIEPTQREVLKEYRRRMESGERGRNEIKR